MSAGVSKIASREALPAFRRWRLQHQWHDDHDNDQRVEPDVGARCFHGASASRAVPEGVSGPERRSHARLQDAAGLDGRGLSGCMSPQGGNLYRVYTSSERDVWRSAWCRSLSPKRWVIRTPSMRRRRRDTRSLPSYPRSSDIAGDQGQRVETGAPMAMHRRVHASPFPIMVILSCFATRIPLHDTGCSELTLASGPIQGKSYPVCPRGQHPDMLWVSSGRVDECCIAAQTRVQSSTRSRLAR